MFDERDKIPRLLAIGETYTILFNGHKGTSTLLESRNAKGSDQGKIVDKKDGRLDPCWLWKFEDFKVLIQLSGISEVKMTPSGYMLMFDGYNVEVRRN